MPSGGDWTPLTGGSSNEVARRGDRVRRRTGPWSPAVHELLGWLQDRGFSRVPRLLETDGGAEILSYLEGQPVFRPWPQEVRTDAWMHELGVWLREYHAAVRSFRPSLGHRFAWGPERPGAGLVVNHGDLGPWNVIQGQGKVVGVIDWDLARFGDPLDDLAQLALEAVPLKPSAEDRLGASPGRALLLGRLRALLAAYGDVTEDRLLEYTPGYLERMAAEVEHLGAAGHEPFRRFAEEGFANAYRAEAQHIRVFFVS